MNYLLAIIGFLLLVLIAGLIHRVRYMAKSRRELEVAREKAETSEKAKQQFLANMSHEIRTPLNAIMGMTNILLRKNPREDQLVYLQAVRESSQLLLALINDILDLAKLEAGKVELNSEPFSIAGLANNIHLITRFKAEEKGLRLKVEVEEKARVWVLGDQRGLQQILINLVGNAIKFTERGEVKLRIWSVEADRDDRINLRLEVADTGIGIDQDLIPIIFESFEQAYVDTGRQYQGTGLGLSIAKQLIEMQGGKIWCESEKGVGTKFHIALAYPLTEAGSEVLPGASLQSLEQMGRQLEGLRVLLVDDNTFNAMVAREELEAHVPEVEVVHAENGPSALKNLEKQTFDIVLMDVQMPGMNGYDTTHQIRQSPQSWSKMPIMAMTANILSEEIDRCFESGMDDFISKPFDTGLLLEKITQLVGTRHLQAQP